MAKTEILLKIHKLVDEANDNQLDAIIEVLQPSNSLYTLEELNSFYKRVKLFEENESMGYSVDGSHALIRSKHKQNGS